MLFMRACHTMLEAQGFIAGVLWNRKGVFVIDVVEDRYAPLGAYFNVYEVIS